MGAIFFTTGSLFLHLVHVQLEDQLPQLTEEVMELQDEIDKELEDHLLKKHKRYAKDMVTTTGSQPSGTYELRP